MTNPKRNPATNKPFRTSNYTNAEIDRMLNKAEQLPEYFRLRVQCLIALAKKFGKRRVELARLEIADLTVTETELEVSFTLAKKRKKGLHQYLKYLEKNHPEVLSMTLPEIKLLWREWQKTTEGHKITETKALKSISLSDKYAPYILNYLAYLKLYYPECKWLFPSGHEVFGAYIVDTSTHLSGSQLLRSLKAVSKTGWLHLFRATKGEEVARLHGRTLESLHNVASALNVTDQTAMHYIERYVPEKQPVET